MNGQQVTKYHWCDNVKQCDRRQEHIIPAGMAVHIAMRTIVLKELLITAENTMSIHRYYAEPCRKETS